MNQEQFLTDVANHQLKIEKDEELYRHLKFTNPETTNQHFHIITWPGYLCFTGDMGTYVFKRVQDMFRFFRQTYNDNDRLQINPVYWSEKLEAINYNFRPSDIEEISSKKVKDIYLTQYQQWSKDYELSDHQKAELWSELEDTFVGCDLSSHEKVFQLFDEFSFYDGSYYLEFQDFWEFDLTDFSPRFLWCCYAIVWGIKQYDDHKGKQV